MTAPRPVRSPASRPRRQDRLLGALGADARDLADGGPVQIVSTGHSKVLVELRDRAVRGRLRPGQVALTALSRAVGSMDTVSSRRPVEGSPSPGVRGGRWGVPATSHRATQFTLDRELGVGPCRPLRDLYRAILTCTVS